MGRPDHQRSAPTRLALEAEAGNDWEEIVSCSIEAQWQFAAQCVQPSPHQQETHYDIANFDADLHTLKRLKISELTEKEL